MELLDEKPTFDFFRYSIKITVVQFQGFSVKPNMYLIWEQKYYGQYNQKIFITDRLIIARMLCFLGHCNEGMLCTNYHHTEHHKLSSEVL